MFSQNSNRDPQGNAPQILDRSTPVPLDGDSDAIHYKAEGGAYFGAGDKTGGSPPPGQPADSYKLTAKVDVVAEAQDAMGGSMPAALFSVGYWVESKASESHGIKNAQGPFVLFQASPHLYDGASQKTAEIYETSRRQNWVWTNNICGHYVVTNTKGTGGGMSDVKGDRHWHTKAKNDTGAGEDSGFGKGDASGAHNAYFQDGHYVVHILASDIIRTTESTDDVWVENFAPHIIKIDIWEDSDQDSSTGAAPHSGYEREIYSYSYENKTDGTGVYPGANHLDTAQKAIAGSGKGGRKIWVRAVFSETMDATWTSPPAPGFKLQLDPQGKNCGEGEIDAVGVQWSKTHVVNDTVTGVITIPPKKHATVDSKGNLQQDHSRDADIVVIARDLAGKTLDADSNGTSDGEDRKHRIKIDSKHDAKPGQKPSLKVQAVSP